MDLLKEDMMPRSSEISGYLPKEAVGLQAIPSEKIYQPEKKESPRWAEAFSPHEEILVPSPGKILERSKFFAELPVPEKHLFLSLPEEGLLVSVNDQENAVVTTTFRHMGKEAGFCLTEPFSDIRGNKFLFLGINGVGLTDYGVEHFHKAQARDTQTGEALGGQALFGFDAPKISECFEQDLSERRVRFIPPLKGKEGLVGVAGLEPLRVATKRYFRGEELVRKGFWTAEPVALIQGESSLLKRYKKEGRVGSLEKESRIVRAFRIPMRLNSLYEDMVRVDAVGRSDSTSSYELRQNVEERLSTTIEMLEKIGVDLEKYPGVTKEARYTCWFFERIGKNAGILCREGYIHQNIRGLQNITLAAEVVDLDEMSHKAKLSKSEVLDAYDQYLLVSAHLLTLMVRLGKLSPPYSPEKEPWSKYRERSDADSLEIARQAIEYFDRGFLREYDQEQVFATWIEDNLRKEYPHSVLRDWFRPQVIENEQSEYAQVESRSLKYLGDVGIPLFQYGQLSNGKEVRFFDTDAFFRVETGKLWSAKLNQLNQP